MCGRYSLDLPLSLSRADREMINSWPLVLDKLDQRESQYNIAPTQLAPVIAAGNDGIEVLGMRWGFVPVWSKDGKTSYSTINARVETLATSKLYGPALKKHRCLVPATGYYEWTGEKGHKQPFNIHDPDGHALFFAGLWSSWRDPEKGGERPKLTFTIITGKPGLVSGEVHDRQPVILPAERWEAWLDLDDDQGAAILDSLPDAPLAYYPVSTAVNNVRNQGPKLIQEVTL